MCNIAQLQKLRKLRVVKSMSFLEKLHVYYALQQLQQLQKLQKLRNFKAQELHPHLIDTFVLHISLLTTLTLIQKEWMDREAASQIETLFKTTPFIVGHQYVHSTTVLVAEILVSVLRLLEQRQKFMGGKEMGYSSVGWWSGEERTNAATTKFNIQSHDHVPGPSFW